MSPRVYVLLEQPQGPPLHCSAVVLEDGSIRTSAVTRNAITEEIEVRLDPEFHRQIRCALREMLAFQQQADRLEEDRE